MHLFEQYRWVFISQKYVSMWYYNCRLHSLRTYVRQALVSSTLYKMLFTWIISLKCHSNPLKRLYLHSYSTQEERDAHRSKLSECFEPRQWHPRALSCYSLLLLWNVFFKGDIASLHFIESVHFIGHAMFLKTLSSPPYIPPVLTSLSLFELLY